MKIVKRCHLADRLTVHLSHPWDSGGQAARSNAPIAQDDEASTLPTDLGRAQLVGHAASATVCFIPAQEESRWQGFGWTIERANAIQRPSIVLGLSPSTRPPIASSVGRDALRCHPYRLLPPRRRRGAAGDDVPGRGHLDCKTAAEANDWRSVMYGNGCSSPSPAAGHRVMTRFAAAAPTVTGVPPNRRPVAGGTPGCVH